MSAKQKLDNSNSVLIRQFEKGKMWNVVESLIAESKAQLYSRDRSSIETADDGRKNRRIGRSM